MSKLPTVHATASGTVGKVTAAPAGPPHTYLGMARSHMSGVTLLASGVPGTSLSLTLVAGFVAENALKAYLSRTGNDAKVRKLGVRHDLVKLWSLAYGDGLPISAKPPDWLEHLGKLHGPPYIGRYSTGVHGMVTPAAQPMTMELEALVDLVAKNL